MDSLSVSRDILLVWNERVQWEGERWEKGERGGGGGGGGTQVNTDSESVNTAKLQQCTYIRNTMPTYLGKKALSVCISFKTCTRTSYLL